MGADAGGAAVALCRRALARAGAPRIAVELWDGRVIHGGRGDEIVDSGERSEVARIVVTSRRAFARILVDPELGFGDAYACGEVEVRGDLVALMEAIYPDASGPSEAVPPRSLRGMLPPLLRVVPLPALRSITPTRARRNASIHYDTPSEFFELWLDRSMSYSCAYFPQPTSSLEAAQDAKMERICAKLALAPGERVVEAGCGWGALALYMARRYGVTVDAYNVSRSQLQWARARARCEGLTDRVRFIEADYRTVAGRFDVFVSVGMLEHVGVRAYPQLGRIIRRCLAPGGRGLIHNIGRSRPMPTHRWIAKRIFPGGYTPSLSEMTTVFEPNGLVVLDVENQRSHYVRTLASWLERFREQEQRITELLGERAARSWHLYLAAAKAGFACGHLQLYQTLFTQSRQPWNPRSRSR